MPSRFTYILLLSIMVIGLTHVRADVINGGFETIYNIPGPGTTLSVSGTSGNVSVGTTTATRTTTSVNGWTTSVGNGTGPGVYYVKSQESSGSQGASWVPYAHSGNYSIQLDSTNSASPWTSGSSISQSVTLQSGKTYALSFWINTEVGSGKGGTSAILVTVSGAASYTTASTNSFTVTNPANVSADDAVWKQYTITFKATSNGTATIKFQDSPFSGNSNVSLDDVTLVVVPEPSTIMAGLLLLGGIGLIERRRLRKLFGRFA